MAQRDVTEVEVRAMLEKATAFEPNVIEGRFMIHVRHFHPPWIVIVEPDTEAKILVVVAFAIDLLVGQTINHHARFCPHRPHSYYGRAGSCSPRCRDSARYAVRWQTDRLVAIAQQSRVAA
jgi:hypothetical protein